MEQRKRESLIPKGTFEVSAPLDDEQRGDLSGTFLRSEVEAPPMPVARIELKRKVLPPPPPSAAARPSFRPAPPKLPSLLPPPPAPRVPTTTPEAGSLRALVAPSYPPPAPVEQPERIDFQDFALRLDVAPMPPPPSSLLPPSQETRAKSLRPALVLIALVAVGAGGWLSRGWFARSVPSSPRATSLAAPAHSTIAPVAAVAQPAASSPVTVPAAAATPVVEPIAATTEAPMEPTVAVPAVAVVEPAAAVETAVMDAPKVEPTAVATKVPTAKASVPSPERVVPVSAEAVVVDGAAADAPALEHVETAADPSPAEHAPPLAEVVSEPLPDTLGREEVIEGIEVLRNEYRACAGELHGTAEIKITIANTGRITHALVGGDFAGTPQGSCLARTLRQARFPSFQQPRLDIVYPIAL